MMAIYRPIRMTWNGRVIHHPVARAAMSAVMVLAFGVMVACIPLMLLLHPVLQLFGRQGTMRTEPSGKAVLALDGDAFRKARR